MEKNDIAYFQKSLINWYDQHYRDLPWRNTKDPYAIWISEIMLQQTQVETVIPYFTHFIQIIPNFSALATIKDDDLYKLWQGLGYYHRATNLKKTAIIILDRFDGVMPCDIKTLQTLPGIGPYTAAAIASIAYEVKVPAIDANVLRVIARITGNQNPINLPKTKDDIYQTVQKILPNTRINDFNQSLMELGALVCLGKKKPRCEECPLQSICVAYQNGLVNQIPQKIIKKQRKMEIKTILMIMMENQIALQKRSNKGLLANLWQPIVLDCAMNVEDIQQYCNEYGLGSRKIIPLGNSKHLFTHIEWQMDGYLIQTNQMNSNWVWVHADDIINNYAIPSAFAPYFKKCHLIR